MKLRNRILMTMMVCLTSMILLCSAVLYADEKEYDFSKAGTIKEGKQTVEITANNEGMYYYAFTPKESGKYMFEFASKDEEHIINPVILAESGEKLNYTNNTAESISLDCSLKGGVKYYIGFYTVTEVITNAFIDINVSKVESNNYIIIKEYNGYESVEVGKSNINGLSWDANTSTLTMNNYVCEDDRMIYINMQGCDDDGDILYIDVKGINKIKKLTAIWVEGYQGTVMFTGTGELNIGDEKSEKSSPFIVANNKIVFDGPSINIVGSFLGEIMFAKYICVLSGNLNIDMYPYKSSDSKSYYSYIYASWGIYVRGGIILIRYEDPIEGCPVNENCVTLFGESTTQILGGTIIFTGNAKVVEAWGNIPDDAVIGKKVVILKGEKIDITKLNMEVLEKTFEYDGTEKKPKIIIDGLKEGVDYKVEYKNNVNIGKAEIIVTGIGNFTGTLKANFDIVAPKGTKVEYPKVGSTVEDENYIYVITKAGSNDGKTVGEVKVTGLKKKSLKEIKIAANVKIDGIIYNVTVIEKNAFKGNKKITKATIGKNVVSIGDNAFANCKKLKQVKINSKKLKKIGKGAFAKDKKLNKIIIKSSKLSKVGKGFVKGTSKKLVITVPKKKKAKYVKKFKKAGFKGKVK